VAALGSQAFCLDHFCTRCYEILDGIDRFRESDFDESVCGGEEQFLADECARRALDICMSGRTLSNLERARLLDILLWCGDVVSIGRPKSMVAKASSVGKPYEKPNFTVQKSGAVFRSCTK
jgi:hypothetical protein